jgi:hypothetical protein
MALFIHRLGSQKETEVFLQGGIIGGASLVDKDLYIHGQTLVFTGASTATVTFAASPANAQVPLSLTQVLAQIVAQTTSAIKPFIFNGRLGLIDAGVPSAATGLAAGSTALAALGFKAATAVTGKVFNAPGGAAPALVSGGTSPVDANTFILITEET